jgi:hypothetical protein
LGWSWVSAWEVADDWTGIRERGRERETAPEMERAAGALINKMRGSRR